MVAVAGAGAGTLVGAFVACVPGMHIYTLLGLTLALAGPGIPLTAVFAVPAFMAAITSWAILNGMTSIILAAPDEGALFTVLPGQQYLLAGCGREAILLTVAGGMGGILVLLGIVFIFGSWLAAVRSVLQPHFHWMIWLVICYMLMSEWPQERLLGETGWRNWRAAWRGPASGLLTFIFAGLLGIIVMNRPLLDPAMSFQGLTPVFVGLFGMPQLIVNCLSGTAIPPQEAPRDRLPVNGYQLFKGILAGALGGGFAAFIPAVSGGIGGMLAGHATAQRDSRVFLIAQGSSKAVYYTGAFLLLFVPGLRLAHGGGAALYRVANPAVSGSEYLLAAGAALVAGASAMLIADPLAAGCLGIVRRIPYQRLAMGAIMFMIVLVGLLFGPYGLLLLTAGTGIGLIPILNGGRRMNGLGVILLPIALNMSGLGPRAAGLIGLH